jgi:hypothetical protein
MEYFDLAGFLVNPVVDQNPSMNDLPITYT